MMGGAQATLTQEPGSQTSGMREVTSGEETLQKHTSCLLWLRGGRI